MLGQKHQNGSNGFGICKIIRIEDCITNPRPLFHKNYFKKIDTFYKKTSFWKWKINLKNQMIFQIIFNKPISVSPKE